MIPKPASREAHERALTRRSLVGRSLAGGGALAALGLAGAADAAASTTPDGSSPSGTSATTYFQDETMNFQTLFALGSAGYGISEVGEVLTTVENINAQGPKQVNEIWAETLARDSAANRFTIAKRSEIYAQPSFYDQIRYTQKFNISPSTIARIKAPTLVMQAQDEQFYPGQSQEVYSQLRSRKVLANFTTSEGAEYHDEPMAPQTRNEVLFDWLDRTLKL